MAFLYFITSLSSSSSSKSSLSFLFLTHGSSSTPRSPSQVDELREEGSAKGVPPKGWVAIKVGQEGEEPQRFVVPVMYLNHPLFVQLLKEAEEEYGFEQKGAITIPCHVEHFRQVQGMIESDNKSGHHHHHHQHGHQTPRMTYFGWHETASCFWIDYLSCRGMGDCIGATLRFRPRRGPVRRRVPRAQSRDFGWTENYNRWRAGGQRETEQRYAANG